MDKKEQLRKKVLKLIEQEDFKKYLIKEVDNLLDSGYINTKEDEESSYLLAKLVLYCCLKREAKQYRPLNNDTLERYKELIKNY